MNKQNLEYELNEFKRIKNGLKAGEWGFINILEDNIYELLYCDLEFQKYAEMFKEILFTIDMYYNEDNGKIVTAEDIINALTPIIEALEADIIAEEIKQQKKDNAEAISSEVRDTFRNIINEIEAEVKNSWKNIGEFIKSQEMPECSKIISDFKEMSKETEKKLKAEIRNWLKDDE